MKLKYGDILPRDLKWLAVLLIINGILCGLVVSLSLFRGQPKFLVAGVLGIPTGIGLLWLNPGWRKVALVLVWFNLIVMPLLILGLAFATLYLHFHFANFANSHHESGPKLISLLHKLELTVALRSGVWIADWLLHFWAYRVLNRPAVRDLFGG